MDKNPFKGIQDGVSSLIGLMLYSSPLFLRFLLMTQRKSLPPVGHPSFLRKALSKGHLFGSKQKQSPMRN